jgi:hypothetical protein
LGLDHAGSRSRTNTPASTLYFYYLEGQNMQSTSLPATQTMENLILITINDQPLSLQASLQHLKKAGKLNVVLLEIAQQNLLEREIQAREIPEPTAEMVEQFLLEFRLQEQLTSPEAFQLWLLKNGTTYAEFKQQVSFRIQQEELKASITADEVQNYFDQRKADLEMTVNLVDSQIAS